MRHLEILRCSVPTEEMTEHPDGRFCAQCQHTIHRVDRLDEGGLDTLMRRSRTQRVCVEVRAHSNNRVALAGGVLAAMAVTFGCAAASGPSGQSPENPQHEAKASPSEGSEDRSTQAVEPDQCPPEQPRQTTAGVTLDAESGYLDMAVPQRGVVHQVELADELEDGQADAPPNSVDSD